MGLFSTGFTIFFFSRLADDDTRDLDVDPTATIIKNAVITNVGGAGFYDDVVDMIDGENLQCTVPDFGCVKEVCRSFLRKIT